MYTIIKAREEPKNCILTNGAAAVKMMAPKRSIQRKSADLLRKDSSSRLLLYLTRKNM